MDTDGTQKLLSVCIRVHPWPILAVVGRDAVGDVVASDEIEEDQEEKQRPAIEQDFAAFPLPRVGSASGADLFLGGRGRGGGLCPGRQQETVPAVSTAVGMISERADGIVLQAFPVRPVGTISLAFRAKHRINISVSLILILI